MYKIINIINKLKQTKNKKQNKKEILGNYTMVDLENQKEFFLKDNIELSQINNLMYIQKNAQIKFTFHPRYDGKDELTFYKKLTEIFKILTTHDRTYNISIYVENRELFKQSKALEYTKNIELTIYTDLNEYTKEEYLEEEKILDSLIESIKTSNLSPYEKYIAVYNIVKQFKEYKENPLNPYEVRNIKEILKNKYIVCVGYSNLLTILLDKVGIPCISISSSIEDISIRNLLPLKESPIIMCGHERNLIKIDDNKYNIHGIYIADATFDNNMNIDLYNNASITYDKLKESESLEKIRFDDYIFDIHTFNEFIEKVNFCLNHEINKEESRFNKERTYQEKVIKAYNYIYTRTLRLLYKLDYNKWNELSQKYNTLISKKYESLKDIEKIYSDFLTELGYYIIKITNKEIDIDKTFEAASNVKKIINGYNDEKVKEWKDITKKIYIDIEKISYPYLYKQEEPRINYLESKYKTKCRVRKK